MTDPVTHYHYIEFNWMKPIKANNDGKTYLMIGDMQNVPDTLLVTLQHGNGSGMFMCKQHGFVYPIKGACAECQNAPRDEALEAGATACSTP